MSYTITYTNGQILALLADQTEDSVSTSLTLVGKNYNGYGSAVNNNFVHLLENFANNTPPISPMEGQLWYSKLTGSLNLYTNDTWKSVGAPIASATQPSSLVNGDFWFDTTNNQLWYYNGINLLNPGKPYGDTSGKTGALSETVIDSTNVARNIVSVYDNGTLLAWFSDKQISLNPASNALYIASTTTIQPGLTLNPAVPGLQIYGTATSAVSFQGYDSSNVMLNNQDNRTFGIIEISNDGGLEVLNSSSTNGILLYSKSNNTSTTIIRNSVAESYLTFGFDSTTTGMIVDGINRGVGINTTTVTFGYSFDVEGPALINNNLTVYSGLTVTTGTNAYNDASSVVKFNPSWISIGAGYSSSQFVNANQGGIVLTNSVNNGVFWLYEHNYNQWRTTVNSIRLESSAASAGYYLGGFPMITTDGNGNYSLGPKINKADGLQTLTGVLELTIGSDTDPAGQLILTSGTISTTLGLEINPGNGSINLNNSQIQNMKSTLSSDSGQVAATKDYVDNSIAAATGGYGGRKPYTLQIDISGFTNTNAQVLGYVKQLLPVNGGDVIYYAQPPGARCNVLCASYTANSGTFTLSINENQIPAQSIVVSTGTSTVTITTGSGTSTTTSTQIVVTSTTWSTATTIVTSVAGTVTVTPPLNTVNYSIKQFQVISISTSAAQTVVTNFVSNGDASATSTGTLLTVSQTDGIYAGAVISGTGYTNGQIVVEVLSTQTVLTNTAPNATPSGSLSFTQVPGFNDWVFLRNL